MFLLLASGASALEAGITDVHDGDATHAELQEFDGVAANGETPSQTDEPLAPGQTQHSCHCTHAHYGWAALDEGAWHPLGVVTAPPRGGAGVPASAEMSPQLRPPIA